MAVLSCRPKSKLGAYREKPDRAIIHGAIPMIESEIYRWCGVFDDLNSDDQLSVARLVKDGGAIEGTVEKITQRLKRTSKVTLLRVNMTNRIVGIAALKTPTGKYRADKFAATGVPITGYETALELGYVVIAEDMQGKRLSGGLCDAIANEICEPAFATTDSSTMMRNLQRSGFTKAGLEWQGRKGVLSLWTITPC